MTCLEMHVAGTDNAKPAMLRERCRDAPESVKQSRTTAGWFPCGREFCREFFEIDRDLPIYV
jgi:hypothetical protein